MFSVSIVHFLWLSSEGSTYDQPCYNQATVTKRPFSVFVLVLLAVLLSASGWLRLQQAVNGWGFLLEWVSAPLLAYLAGSGVLWGASGLVVIYGLGSGRAWAGRVTLVTALFYGLSYWLERLFFWRWVDAQANWPFALGETLLGLGLVYAILSRRPPQPTQPPSLLR